MAKRASLPLVVFSLLVVPFFIGSSSFSQPNSKSSLLPLESVLNPDGSVRTDAGVTGSFDPTGWHMFLGPHGQPMFSRTAGTLGTYENAGSDTGDVHWDDSFPGPIGTNGFVTAIAVHGNSIYFGGLFKGTESIEASNIVRWDGVSWSALGTGLDGEIRAMIFVDSILYVGGYFSHAGGLPVHRLAAWDGNSWSTVGPYPHDGVDSSGGVLAMASVGSDLYVGGTFLTVGDGIAANNIARWDGSSWHALGTGTYKGDQVYALATDGVSIFAGGFITKAGGASANNIARWDGTAWHTLGTSPNDGSAGGVFALVYARGILYVGGQFTTVGGSVSAYNIAGWDGTRWFSPGFSLQGYVASMCFRGGLLYMSGHFTGAVPNRGYVVAWDSARQTVSQLANGLNGEAAAITGYKGDVYFGGGFTDFSNGDTTLPSNFIARWTGKEWMTLGAPRKPANSIAGMAGIQSIAVKDSDLYLGGMFDAAGTVAANNIVKWESRTRSWKALGNGPSNGVDGAVQTIYAGVSGAIYVGGTFQHAGGKEAACIAKWDGTTWSPLGSGVHGLQYGATVFAIAEVSSATEYHLYAGGRFDSAGAVAASNVAEWTGTAWVSLGSGVAGSGSASPGAVLALRPIFDRNFLHTKLYVGGDFIYAGGVPATRIAVWSSGKWSALGTPAFEGVLGPVYAIAGNRSAIYVGGYFQRAGGSVAVSNIAKWDGTSWSSVGKGVDGSIRALLLTGNGLFATGDFNNAGAAPVNKIARWDFADSSWHSLGSGLNESGLSLAPLGDDLYVSGWFTKAGGKRSYKLAHWNQNVTMTSITAGRESPGSYSLAQNYPNPFNPRTVVSSQLSSVSDVRIVVYDLLGREVAVLVNERRAPGKYTDTFDGSGLASGIYICRMTAGSFAQSRKMILLK